jgi:hypothetical protein
MALAATQCSWERARRFGGTYRLHLEGRKKAETVLQLLPDFACSLRGLIRSSETSGPEYTALQRGRSYTLRWIYCLSATEPGVPSGCRNRLQGCYAVPESVLRTWNSFDRKRQIEKPERSRPVVLVCGMWLTLPVSYITGVAKLKHFQNPGATKSHGLDA